MIFVWAVVAAVSGSSAFMFYRGADEANSLWSAMAIAGGLMGSIGICALSVVGMVHGIGK